MLARPGNIASIDIGNRQREQAAAARLLVMGAEGVGKSAAIVRFTTGRFIHQYCPSTQDWLYKHQLYCQQENLPPGAIQIELLEQKEANCREDSSATSETNQPQSSLALRVASDQRADRELRECQQLLDKLQWANACVIVYSLTSSGSFAKAREYLDLLDWMYTNRALPSNQTDQQSIRHKVEQRLTGGGGGGGRRHLALPISQQQCRPPVLLLGNKHDLASSCPGTRQVTLEQGHELAVQHKCLFAELSVSGCANSIRNVLFDLIGRVLPTTYAPEQRHSVATSPPLTQLVKWQASPPNLSTSIKTQLIKTQMPLVSSSHSTQVAGSLNEVATTTHVPRQPPVAAATCRPLVTSSYSDPRQVAVAQCSAAMVVAQPQAASKQSSSPTNASRYGALKSTFKKASLAIVGGKALASRASTGRNSTGDAPSMAPVAALKRNSTTSSNLSELVSEHSFSVRGSIGSLSSSSTTAPAAGHTTTNEQAPPVAPPPSKLNKSSNWIKSRFARQESSGSEGKSSQSAIVSNTCELQSLQPEEQVASGKFKRPLFKYKNRLRTVGFEPSFSSSSSGNNRTTGPTTKQSSESIQIITTGSLDGATGAQQQQQPRQTRASGTASPLSSSLSSSSRSSAPNAPPTHDANRCSSGRSSSSLSASDTYYSSLFVVCQAANNQPPPEQCAASVSPSRHAPSPPQPPPPPPPGGANQRQDSRSTLSRASTSLGSYDEMLEDMESAASDCTVPPPQPQPAPTTTATATPPGRKISADSKPPVCATAGLKTRFQVVKSVQSTLTSLAKSTRATVTPAQHPAVKRSFCSALMSSSMSLASPRVCESAIAPVQQVAKIEAIRAIPAVLGYCK